jgi:membrane-associated phospholipid phosphatase
MPVLPKPSGAAPVNNGCMPDAVVATPPPRLLPRRALPAIAVADVMAAVVFVVLAARFHDQNRAGPLDRAIDGRLTHHLLAYRVALRALIEVGAPTTVALSGFALALWCLATGRRRGALLSILGPGLAALATDSVLKPVIGRTLYGSLSFPSGHTTGAVAVAGVVGVLMLGPSHPRSVSVHTRRLTTLAALAVSGGTAIGLVVLKRHYSTDTVGGVCVALVVITLVAVVIDSWPSARRATT